MIMDLAEHLLKGGLMIYFFHGLLYVKGRYIKHEKLVEAGFLVLTTSFYMAVSYLPVLKELFYGNREGMVNSRSSILPMFISLLLMLLYCLYFYEGKRSRIVYLVFTVYTLNELVMFTLHAFFTLLLYYSIRILKKNLSYAGKEPDNLQVLFLTVPSAMGLCFCILLRSIMFAFNGSQINYLMDEYPETNVLVPITSALNLSLIILSAVILKKLVESSEKEVLVGVYQNQISDMEEHMKDVEHLYDGIRGMRHDMKNYVADLEILLKKDHKSNGESEREVQRYLDGMCNVMEELDMKCNTGNPVTDVVISRKMRKAQQEKIDFECSFVFPTNLNISAFDLSILLNNGLDNALEASKKEERPYIRLDSYVRERMFFIEIRNAFTGSLITGTSKEDLWTSKKDSFSHGLGIKNMKNCVEKYFGALNWKSSNGEFLLTIMLQGKEK